jgi:hypothetical protein
MIKCFNFNNNNYKRVGKKASFNNKQKIGKK